MSTHTVHQDIHSHGLADGCPRCEEHSHNPLATLDDKVITNLLRRVASGEPGRSDNEDTAMLNIKQVLDGTAALGRLDHKAVARYLSRNGVHLIAV